jgi:hypothetical protein
LSTVIAVLSRIVCPRGPATATEWWGYLGSFGDDFFTDDADDAY